MQIVNYLPNIMELNEYGGQYDTYIEALYKIFENDFVKNKPIFRGRRLALKYHPEFNGKAYTFYHMTHIGIDENNRTPEFRRSERLPWARPSIEKGDECHLKIWEQIRNGKNRICIWLDMGNDPHYFVILDDRKDYILPWTAFVAQYPHEKRKKEKEYNEWLKAKGVQQSQTPS